MFCAKCGNQIADTAAFCMRCGAKVSEMRKQNAPGFQQGDMQPTPMNFQQPMPMPMNYQPPMPVNYQQPGTPQNKKNATGFTFAIIGVVLLIAALIVTFASTGKTFSSRRAFREEDALIITIICGAALLFSVIGYKQIPKDASQSSLGAVGKICSILAMIASLALGVYMGLQID